MNKATNSAIMRKKNEKIILSLINKAPISRVDIAKKTGLTKAAITIIVDDLMQKNIVFEQSGKASVSGVGRTPVLLSLNKDALYMVGIDITRLDITVGITNLGGEIIESETIAICPPQEAFEKIGKIYKVLLEKSKIDVSKIYKMSVAAPGPIDVKNGIILNPPNFKQWHNIAVAHELERISGLNVIVQNVSSANAMAEKYFGSAANSENFLALQVDEGIGSGIFLNDTLFTGPCELGHISIMYNGIKCDCGNCGCLEKYASIPKILENTPFASWQDVVDSDNTQIIEKQADYLSAAITSANNIFDFDTIVLGGDLTYKPEIITKRISQKLKQNKLSVKDVNVCAGTIKSKLMVAISIAINDFFK